MGDGDFSQQDLEKMKWIMNDPNADPSLKKTLKMYEELMLLPQRSQDESDRRWQILVEAEEKIPEAEKPKTMGAHRELLLKYGFTVGTPVPRTRASDEGDFNDFMEAYGNGGMQMLADYEMKSAPSAKPKCDECGQEAGLRCKQCGERYCSRVCQRKAWPAHKKMCTLVAGQRAYSQRLNL